MAHDSRQQPQHFRVVVVGAGAAGLCMAARMAQEGIRDFLVLDKSDGVGGTWRDNTYPDSACDVPSHLYSFSFAPNPGWSRKWAKQPEILSYFESMVDRFSLTHHLRLNTEVSSLTWSEDRSSWSILTTSGDEIEAQVVVNGLGQLSVPNIPDIGGLSGFTGEMFHSARWNHDHDLRGERVAVIGIGASAIQFVPPVAEQAEQLTLFQRSANYVGPKADREFKDWELTAFARIPGVREAYRQWTYWRLEARFAVMRRGSAIGKYYQKKFRKELEVLVDEDLPLDALAPDYQPGCKRILLSNDWYPALKRPNVSVVTDPVDHVDANHIVTADGSRFEADTLILGTGFKSTDFLTPMVVTGRDGADLNKVWADGAVAYMSLAVTGFPNMFLLYGPNSNLGHNSILFMIEQQVGYVLAALEQLAERECDSLEVSESAMRRWDEEMVRRSADTVWATGCDSWYKTDSGRITNNWIGHTTEYRKRLNNPRWSDWNFSRARAPHRIEDGVPVA